MFLTSTPVGILQIWAEFFKNFFKNSERNSIGKAAEFLVFFLGRFGHIILVRDENFWWPRGGTVQRRHFARLYYQDHEGNNFPPNSADMEKKFIGCYLRRFKVRVSGFAFCVLRFYIQIVDFIQKRWSKSTFKWKKSCNIYLVKRALDVMIGK